MYVYQSTNPCVCGSPSTPSDPDCPDTCRCLRFCNITISALDPLAVAPCGVEGTVDILSDDFDHDTCACGDDDLTFTVNWFDPDVFDSAEITGSELTWTHPEVEDLVPQYGEIVIKGKCGLLEAYVTLTIGMVDMCTEDCDEGFECDPCDGVCVAIVPDIILD